jgi:tetratricopeptide (TPR) repeat protein
MISKKNKTLKDTNDELATKNDALDQAATKERNLRVLATNRLEERRRLTQKFVNDLPEWLDRDTLASPTTREQILDWLEEIKSTSDSADDQIVTLRGKQGILQRRGQELVKKEKYKEAITAFDAARQIAQQVVDSNPREKDKSAGNLAAALANLGDAHLANDEVEKGNKCYEQALEIRRQIANAPTSGELPPSETHADLAAMLVRFADLWIKRGDHHGSLTYLNEAVREFGAIGPATLRPIDRSQYANALFKRGKARYLTGDREGGRADFDQSRQLLRSLIAAEKLNLFYRRQLAFIAAQAGEVELTKAGDATRAGEWFAESLKHSAALVAQPPVLMAFRQWGYDLYGVATVALRRNDHTAAEKHYRECLEARQFVLKGAPNNVWFKIDVMMAQARCGQHAEAAATAQRVLVAADKLTELDTKQQLYRAAAWGFGLSAAALDADGPPADHELRRHYMAKAFVALTKAFDAGYRSVEAMETDPDFDPLRDDPRFADLIAKMKKK